MERQIDDLVANPQHHFKNPVEVLDADELNYDDKRRILESWKLDASRLAESTAENMSGGEQGDLREVSNTLLKLDAMEKTPEVVIRAEPQTRKNVGLGLAAGAGIGLAVGVVLGAAFPVLGMFPLMLEGAAAGAVIGGAAAALRSAVKT